MNTNFGFLYRDGCNYKKWNEVILSGCLTSNQKSDIISTLNDGEYFIPEQIGLPVERFGAITEDDHCWCELALEDINDTNDPPTIEMTAEELYRRFMETDGEWDDVTYAIIGEGIEI